MSDRYENMLRKIKLDEPCKEMFGRVIAKIEEAEAKRRRYRVCGFCLISIASLIAIYPAVSLLDSRPIWGIISTALLLALFATSMRQAIVRHKSAMI